MAVRWPLASVASIASASTVVLGVAYWLRRRQLKRQQPSEIAQIAREVRQLLKERHPKTIEGITDEVYQLPPFIPKAVWARLGDALRDCEFRTRQRVPGERCITLRLDGSGFSKLTKRLSSSGAFSEGYSNEFAQLMRECCQSLMVKFSAICGYTQSDEMTLVISAASIVRGEQQCHSHGGRVVKLCTLAAAHVTALFNFRLQALFASRGLQMEDQHLANFDCRLGSFETLEEAMSLVLWRAADCGVNGVSDAVYKSKLPCAKGTMRLGTSEKLKWLAENRLLPLQPHQAYGSYFVKVRRLHAGLNPKTGETSSTLRSTIEEVPKVNLLRLAAADGLFPADDVEAA